MNQLAPIWSLLPHARKISEYVTVKATVALPDPIPTQTVNSVAYNLPRVGMTDGKSVYRASDGLDRLTIEHTRKKRTRSVIRLDRRSLVENPFTTGTSLDTNTATYLVSDRDESLVTAVEADWHLKLLLSVLAEGSPDYSLRFLQGEV